MVLYLRQALVCPMLPIASVIVSSCDFHNRAPLSRVILNELKYLNLESWINDENSVMSSRMIEIIKRIDDHHADKVILYGCFTSFMSIMEYYLKKSNDENKRQVFILKASMSVNARKLVLQEFEKSENGILLLTYLLGAEGLNLQFASTVLLADFWWNASKIQQAIGRIFRFGQIRDEINVYFFTSETGIEKILFLKQKAKLALVEEIKTGSVKVKIPNIKMDQIIRLIGLDENEKLMRDIRFY